MSKKIVHYKDSTPDFYNIIGVGHSAMVIPVDHPGPYVSNTKPVRTSTVIRLLHDGFETRNTIYKREKNNKKNAELSGNRTKTSN